MEIKGYQKDRDERQLMQLIEAEGEEWEDYWGPANSGKFKAALEQSITHVAYAGEELCGFARSLDDCGLNILLMDLLVAPAHRRKGIGRGLINQLLQEYPEHEIYVLSDNDEYYQGQGFRPVGSLFDLKQGGY